MPISKKQVKLIASLQQKKYRLKEGLFSVEGVKVVDEFLNSNYQLDSLYCVEDVADVYSNFDCVIINNVELRKISQLKSPNKVLALFKIPSQDMLNSDSGLKVMLDDINDPGNLGTIIRLCDWFGVKHIVCTKNTVDCYNHKVVQATMGSLTRVSVEYIDSSIDWIKESKESVFVTDMDGDSIYKTTLPKRGIIVMGNEANGVRQELKKLATHKITIPRFGSLQKTESLNVATATAIVLSEFMRNIN